MNIRKLIPRSVAVKLIPLKKYIFRVFFGYEYQADGLIVTGHNLEFLNETNFKSSWSVAVNNNNEGWKGNVPDIRWRVHIAIWAAKHATFLEGDFVECGVHTGILSHAICNYLRFEDLQKKFWLFDTFEGIPVDQLSSNEISRGENFNKEIYFDCYDMVKKSFSKYENVKLVKGLIPSSFENVEIGKVCFLSIDLNNAYAEVEALKFFWDKMVPGGLVVFDDYGFAFHKEQKTAIDEFFKPKDVFVATLPTGQGVVIKPPLS